MNLCLHPLQYPDGAPVWRNTWLPWPKEKRIDPVTESFVRYISKECEG